MFMPKVSNPNMRTAALGNGWLQRLLRRLIEVMQREPTVRELTEWTMCHRGSAWRVLKYGQNYPRQRRKQKQTQKS